MNMDCPLLFVVAYDPAYVELYFNPVEILYVVKKEGKVGWALGFTNGNEFQITEDDARKILKRTGVIKL